MNDHGNLVVYLERFKITDLDGCLKCGTENCSEACDTVTGPLSPASLMYIMLASPEKWE